MIEGYIHQEDATNITGIQKYPTRKSSRTSGFIDKYWGTRVSFSSGFLGAYAQQWDCWVIWQFYFHFFKESPHCSP